MEFTKIHYTGVRPDGTFHNEQGSVETDGCVRFGDSYGNGCGLEGCHCSDGYWMTIVLPRTSYGIVEGVHVKFKDANEMYACLPEPMEEESVPEVCPNPSCQCDHLVIDDSDSRQEFTRVVASCPLCGWVEEYRIENRHP